MAAERSSWTPPAKSRSARRAIPGPPPSGRPPRFGPPTGRSSTAGRCGRRTRSPRTRTGGAVLEEPLEQPGSGHVQEGRDAHVLQRRTCDGRPPATSASGGRTSRMTAAAPRAGPSGRSPTRPRPRAGRPAGRRSPPAAGAPRSRPAATPGRGRAARHPRPRPRRTRPGPTPGHGPLHHGVAGAQRSGHALARRQGSARRAASTWSAISRRSPETMAPTAP